jgi:hypothetical protein
VCDIRRTSGESLQIKSETFKTDLADLNATLESCNRPMPRAVVRCLSASSGYKDRFCLRIRYVGKGLDGFSKGHVLVVADSPHQAVRFVSTVLSHGDPDPDKWFTVMYVEPISCTCEDLEDVFLISEDNTGEQ